jgi:hypothetical protein
MGTPYVILDHVDLEYNSLTDIVLEIGSDNGEGSSQWLHNWATTCGMKFYSVDVEHSDRERTYPEIEWVVSNSGSMWCKDVLPTLNKTIKILYLDNFDYIHPDTDPIAIEQYQMQIQAYAQRGVVMNNQNCMEEHRLQTKYCLPFMADQSIIIMDDTYYNPQLESQPADELEHWQGKCTTAMPLMIEAGFSIIRDQQHNINYAIRTR